jgi:hypothetical protein
MLNPSCQVSSSIYTECVLVQFLAENEQAIHELHVSQKLQVIKSLQNQIHFITTTISFISMDMQANGTKKDTKS